MKFEIIFIRYIMIGKKLILKLLFFSLKIDINWNFYIDIGIFILILIGFFIKAKVTH